MNAATLVEDYFVTPPGNIPLESSGELNIAMINEWDWNAMRHRDKGIQKNIDEKNVCNK